MQGSCLCGAVRFEIDGPPAAVGNCHCQNCRKVHGSPFATHAQLATDALVVTAGKEHLRSYTSSEQAERSFCEICGSGFTFSVPNLPDLVWVAAGLIDDTPELRPQRHIFVSAKASWHEILDDLPQHATYPDAT